MRTWVSLAQDYTFQEGTKDWFVGKQGHACNLSREIALKVDKMPSFSLETPA